MENLNNLHTLSELLEGQNLVTLTDSVFLIQTENGPSPVTLRTSPKRSDLCLIADIGTSENPHDVRLHQVINPSTTKVLIRKI